MESWQKFIIQLITEKQRGNLQCAPLLIHLALWCIVVVFSSLFLPFSLFSSWYCVVCFDRWSGERCSRGWSCAGCWGCQWSSTGKSGALRPASPRPTPSRPTPSRSITIIPSHRYSSIQNWAAFGVISLSCSPRNEKTHTWQVDRGRLRSHSNSLGKSGGGSNLPTPINQRAFHLWKSEKAVQSQGRVEWCIAVAVWCI